MTDKSPMEVARDVAIELSKRTGLPVDHDSFDRAFQQMHEPLSGMDIGAALVEMGKSAVKAKLSALTLSQALEEFNRLYPPKTRFYRKRRTRSMRGK